MCTKRKYWLRAINVRTNHVHSVVSAALKPEPILQLSSHTRPENYGGPVCYLRMSNHGLGTVVRPTCGKNDMWKERLTTFLTARETICRDSMIECQRNGALPHGRATAPACVEW